MVRGHDGEKNGVDQTNASPHPIVQPGPPPSASQVTVQGQRVLTGERSPIR
jgi:hypothetical protein